MGKLKPVIQECILKWFFGALLFFFCLSFFPAITQAQTVKYFWKLSCNLLAYEDNCPFVRETKVNELEKGWSYYIVGYLGGIRKSAVKIANFQMEMYSEDWEPTLSERLEFDAIGRLIIHEFNLHIPNKENFKNVHPGLRNTDFLYDYELCKFTYGKQIKETRCYDKKGKLKNRESYSFKGSLLEKRLVYDESDRIKAYSIYDHQTFIEKEFTPEHKLLEERDMRSYLD